MKMMLISVYGLLAILPNLAAQEPKDMSPGCRASYDSAIPALIANYGNALYGGDNGGDDDGAAAFAAQMQRLRDAGGFELMSKIGVQFLAGESVEVTQNLWDWTHSHVRAFEFFAGTSRLVVPDNLKSGVKAPCYYEPELNRTYGDFSGQRKSPLI